MKYCLLFGLMTSIGACVDPVVDGYTDKISYHSEDSISIYLNAEKDKNNYTVSIADINGNELFTVNSDISTQDTFPASPYRNGFQYHLTSTFQLPLLKSGVYLIENKIPFLVKPRLSERYDFLILYSSNTENAYSSSGGKSTYVYNSSEQVPAKIVSFQRPIELPFHSTEFLKWMGKDNSSYKIGYISDQDLDDYELMSTSRLLIIPGHSEYWTRTA